MNKNIIIKTAKWFIPLIALALIAQVITKNILSFDKTLSDLEASLLINEELTAQLGKVESISLTKRTSVNSSEHNPEYRLYDFLVTGKQARALVVVRVDNMGVTQSEHKISIKSVNLK